MIIVVVILLLIIFYKSGQSENKYIAVFFGGRKAEEKFLPFMRFYKLSAELNWIEMRVVNAAVFDIGVENFFKNMRAVLKNKGFIDHAAARLGADSKIFFKKYEKIIESECRYFTKIVNKPVKCDFLIKIQPVGNRHLYGFKYTDEDVVEANFKYNVIDTVMRGDQWTMISDKIMNDYKKKGFKVECFGSPFNVRLQYFGSIFESDKCFGRIGTCIDILDQLIKTGELKWNEKLIIGKNDIIKLVISPPSSYELLLLVIKKLRILTEKRKYMIHLGLPKKFHEGMVENNTKMADIIQILAKAEKYTYTELYDAYSYIEQKKKTVRVPWFNYLISKT
jgi:hypothetical protein